MGKESSYSIVKNNVTIRNALKSRFEELSLKMADIESDARARNVPMDKAALYKYIGGWHLGIPSEEKILWLCVRYGIRLQFIVGDPIIKDGKETYVLLPYDEKKSIENLKKMFPNKWEKKKK